MCEKRIARRMAQVLVLASVGTLVGCVELADEADFPSSSQAGGFDLHSSASSVASAAGTSEMAARRGVAAGWNERQLTADLSGTSETIIIYKDNDPWYGEARDEAILNNEPFNLVRGVDYQVRPTAALAAGIPEETEVVIIPSNSVLDVTEASISGGNVRSPAAQDALDAFVRRGGRLLMHLADNAPSTVAYVAPGMAGPPVEDANDNMTVRVAVNDHPFVRGPDGELGTWDDATNSSLALISACCSSHGYLTGVLPQGHTVLARGQNDVPIYAEYPLGDGIVIVGTFTFEFGMDGLYGNPDRLLINHFWRGLYEPMTPPSGGGGCDY